MAINIGLNALFIKVRKEIWEKVYSTKVHTIIDQTSPSLLNGYHTSNPI
jgi:hypothetical protein